MEIVEFEIKKVRRQLDLAMRKMHHLKQDLFYYVGMIVADLLVIFVTEMILNVGMTIEKLLVALNYYSEKYTEVIRKYNVVTFLTEQRNCQKVLTRYQGYMDQLEEWMLALQNDALTLTEWELEEEFQKMDLNTNIPTASQLHGPMKQMTRRIVLIFRYNGKI